MATKQIIHGIFGDEVPLLEACKKLRASGIRIADVFTPFPVHGIDPIVGIPRTRIAICAFIYGITGLSLATLMMWYMMVSDWPNDIGGKPNWNYYSAIPAFIPISFEATVFCAAHGNWYKCRDVKVVSPVWFTTNIVWPIVYHHIPHH